MRAFTNLSLVKALLLLLLGLQVLSPQAALAGCAGVPTCMAGGDCLPEWWHSGGVPRAKGSRLDRKKEAEWIAAHPEEWKFYPQFVSKYRREITQKELEDALKKTFKQVLNDADPKKPFLFVIGMKAKGPISSNLWIAGLLKDLFPKELGDSDYVPVFTKSTYKEGDTDIFASVDGSEALPVTNPEHIKKLNSGKYNILFVDDILYSGYQLASTIQAVDRSVFANKRTGFFRNRQAPPPPVFAITPFATDRSLTMLPSFVKSYRAEKVWTVGELLAQLPPEEQKKFKGVYDWRQKIFWTLTSGEWGVGDKFSYDSSATTGRVMGRQVRDEDGRPVTLYINHLDYRTPKTYHDDANEDAAPALVPALAP